MFRDLTGQTAFHQRKAQFLDAIGGKDFHQLIEYPISGKNSDMRL